MKALQIAEKLRIQTPKSAPNQENRPISENKINATKKIDEIAKKLNLVNGGDRGGDPKAGEEESFKAVPTKIPRVIKKQQEQLSQSKGPVPNPSELRLFVKNLSQATTEAKLKAYFSRWGVVSDVCIRQPDVKYHECTNMAFITFSNFYNESPIEIPIHVIDGKSVPINLIGTMPNSRHPLVVKSNSVMVTGAIHRCADADLLRAFSKFGKVVKITRKRDPADPCQFLRYAFIVFDSTWPVDKVVEKAQLIRINGQVVDIRRVKNQ